MKRIGNLYGKIIAKENLEIAYGKARRGKTWQDSIKRIDAKKEEYLEQLHQILKKKEFRTSEYKQKMIYEPKLRTIYILPFYPDRIVQHAIMNILEPIWDNRLIHDTYACRLNKGQHKGSRRCMEFVKRNKYCLKCDISKFYPSINHEKLFQIIAKKIKCPDTLAVLEEIIKSIPGEANVPIGNYLSQWFGNIYLNELDQLVKHQYKVKDYVRYCDDFLLFSDDKIFLRKMKGELTKYVNQELKMKMSKCELFPTAQGVDFLGYRHFPQGYILLRKTTAKRVKRRIEALPWKVKRGLIDEQAAISVIASTRGWLQWANTYNFKLNLKLDEIQEGVENGKICRLR